MNLKSKEALSFAINQVDLKSVNLQYNALIGLEDRTKHSFFVIHYRIFVFITKKKLKNELKQFLKRILQVIVKRNKYLKHRTLGG